MLLREIKTIYHKELDALYSKEEVASSFKQIVEHFLGLDPIILALNPNLMVTKEEEQPLFESLASLKLEKPLQYILGEAHFYGSIFKVNSEVLIPRPETEELVAWMLEDIKASQSLRNKEDKLRILDLGTGSGCIAISLAKELSNASIYALDISETALAIAKENAISNEVEIQFLKEDILSLDALHTCFDIIVSNPPYVRELEKDEIKNNVKAYEPGVALFVPNKTPLLFYEKIVLFAKKNLEKKGTLYLEINEYLGKETQRLLEAQNFSEIELRKDVFKKDRMLKGKHQ